MICLCLQPSFSKLTFATCKPLASLVRLSLPNNEPQCNQNLICLCLQPTFSKLMFVTSKPLAILIRLSLYVCFPGLFLTYPGSLTHIIDSGHYKFYWIHVHKIHTGTYWHIPATCR
jgi:hypothetical protein